jgi:hypothetical protein
MNLYYFVKICLLLHIRVCQINRYEPFVRYERLMLDEAMLPQSTRASACLSSNNDQKIFVLQKCKFYNYTLVSTTFALK